MRAIPRKSQRLGRALSGELILAAAVLLALGATCDEQPEGATPVPTREVTDWEQARIFSEHDACLLRANLTHTDRGFFWRLDTLQCDADAGAAFEELETPPTALPTGRKG